MFIIADERLCFHTAYLWEEVEGWGKVVKEKFSFVCNHWIFYCCYWPRVLEELASDSQFGLDKALLKFMLEQKGDSTEEESSGCLPKRSRGGFLKGLTAANPEAKIITKQV